MLMGDIRKEGRPDVTAVAVDARVRQEQSMEKRAYGRRVAEGGWRRMEEEQERRRGEEL